MLGSLGRIVGVDAATGGKLWERACGHRRATALALASHADWGAAATDEEVFAFRVSTGEILWTERIARLRGRRLAISGNGERVAVATEQGEVVILNDRARCIHSFRVDVRVGALRFSRDGALLGVIPNEVSYSVGPWDVRRPPTFPHHAMVVEPDTGRVFRVETDDTVRDLSFSPRGDAIAIGSYDGHVYLTDREGKALWKKATMGAGIVGFLRNDALAVATTQGRLCALRLDSSEVLWERDLTQESYMGWTDMKRAFDKNTRVPALTW